MARIIRVESDGPVEVKPQEKSAWICACGLTGNAPYCDGSHKQARSEEPGHLYEYADDGTRHRVCVTPKSGDDRKGGAASGD